MKDTNTKHDEIKKNLELAVRCSAMAFLRLRRQKVVAMLGSLCDKLKDLNKWRGNKHFIVSILKVSNQADDQIIEENHGKKDTKHT